METTKTTAMNGRAVRNQKMFSSSIRGRSK
jgi:hypothetical protein